MFSTFKGKMFLVLVLIKVKTPGKVEKVSVSWKSLIHTDTRLFEINVFYFLSSTKLKGGSNMKWLRTKSPVWT